MNDENLIPFSKRTPEEAKAIRSKGGRKSGEERRKKRRMRELMQMAVMLPASEEDKAYYNKIFNTNAEYVDNEMAFVASTYKGARDGVESDKKIMLRLLGEDDELNERIRSNEANEKLRKAEIEGKNGTGKITQLDTRFCDIIKQTQNHKNDLEEYENGSKTRNE